MESYENLRLIKKDKIPKRSLFERLFKKDNKFLEENLDFLEERYQEQKDFTQQNPKENIPSDFRFEDPWQENLRIEENLQKPLMESKEDRVSFDSVILEKENLKESVNTSLGVDEKEAVFSGVDFNTREIPFKMVLLVFACMFLALFLFVPKIYMRNNIYYASRNIIQLQAQLDSLNEENKHIKKQLEDIKFKNLTHELDF
ncbi:hypothetical protein LS70_007470 [Helicobacter sp. MIT 11-5569]|uniref:hypothetical protein n=1 Tax=Helicobacter sp. MIT 11-5569 TaxID=1548151 RepID=UPI00051FAB6F|nr:hypothetical protein [Helicobacter sp. MIT 11-5569]TLD82434.1 hypothetical protein LS70_007470 [Helicobacter sp. MIT 11-5569]